ncbi:MAG: GNAT family N-acetyltransferase [Rhodobacter sp.]|nr:GNAT family N-acetyltransferase [Rhodobacter sp.]
MTLPEGPALIGVVEATWPPARATRLGPWTIRDGRGGGQRVAATTAEAPVIAADLVAAERAMAELDQPSLFMIRPGEGVLDALLEASGYRIKDPVALYAIETTQLTDGPLPPVSAFHIWPPLAIMADLWAAGGIGPGRLAVMDRAEAPKTAILARQKDQPAGAAFVACAGDIAMIHAIEVTPPLRRHGVGANILRAAAHWAQDRGARFLTLAVTRENGPANALYASLGMQVVGQYHYRIK